MSAREAVVQVLRDAGEPLHAEEITKRILENQLWATSGKTPCATIEAQICTDMQKRGATSPFVRTAPRTFALRAAVPEAQDISLAAKPPSAKVAPADGLSFTESAEKVLNEFGRKSPMHYRAITETAIKQGWLATAGKTPPASMYAQLITEIRRDKSHGRFPRFVQHGKGYLG
jgi:restriction system protein